MVWSARIPIGLVPFAAYGFARVPPRPDNCVRAFQLHPKLRNWKRSGVNI
jgi:hypothetical protein